MVRAAGAREVHLRISSPPTTGPCHYGIDTPRRSELIASRQSIEDIRAYIAADSLGYMSHEGLLQAVSDPEGSRHCTACFSGRYPVAVSQADDAARPLRQGKHQPRRATPPYRRPRHVGPPSRDKTVLGGPSPMPLAASRAGLRRPRPSPPPGPTSIPRATWPGLEAFVKPGRRPPPASGTTTTRPARGTRLGAGSGRRPRHAWPAGRLARSGSAPSLSGAPASIQGPLRPRRRRGGGGGRPGVAAARRPDGGG